MPNLKQSIINTEKALEDSKKITDDIAREFSVRQFEIILKNLKETGKM
jgi:hypothetical protein